MATKKSASSASKSVPKKAAAAVKSAATKATQPASKPSKTAARVNTADIKVPAGREQKLAEQALKLIDDAAAVLRDGIRSGAKTTATSRIEAKKKAHSLLEKAAGNLSKAVDSSTSVLQSVISRL